MDGYLIDADPLPDLTPRIDVRCSGAISRVTAYQGDDLPQAALLMSVCPRCGGPAGGCACGYEPPCGPIVWRRGDKLTSMFTRIEAVSLADAVFTYNVLADEQVTYPDIIRGVALLSDGTVLVESDGPIAAGGDVTWGRIVDYAYGELLPA